MARSGQPEGQVDASAKPPAGGSGVTPPLTKAEPKPGLTPDEITARQDAEDPLPSAPPPPKWVRLTIPDYPNVTHLLFHWDGTVTWK